MSRRLVVSWALMGAVLTAALVVGAIGDPGPSSNRERVYEIAETLKCPQCAGQSVAESDAEIAREIRAEIANLVETTDLSDREISDQLASAYAEEIRLEPPRSGVAGLVWLIPVVVVVAAAVGLAVALRRWSAAEPLQADEADRRLVEAELARRSRSGPMGS